MAEIHDQFDTILILDFGSQYSHLITRRCRELNVYAELMPCTEKMKDLKFKPKGIILSGSPYSVYDADAPHVDPDVFEMGVPVLGICYGLQEMAWNMNGKVTKCDHREYGFAQLQINKIGSGKSPADTLSEGPGDEMGSDKSRVDALSEGPGDETGLGKSSADALSEGLGDEIVSDKSPVDALSAGPGDETGSGKSPADALSEGPGDEIGSEKSPVDALFEGLGDEMQVWMSHGDQLTEMPSDFHVIGSTKTAPYAAVAHNSKPFYGIQFHPEVTHTPRGKEVIGRFVLNICGCKPNWTMEEFIGKEIARIRQLCGPKGRVIGAVSGGVDSTVAAKLMHEAIGDRFHAIMVDNGVLRLNEAQQVHTMLNRDLGVNLTVVDASELFLSRLAGVEDPEQKRKIIGNTFINVFEDEATKLEAVTAEKEASGAEAKGKIEWLLQGTLYPDVIESISFKGPSATIKTHHNVGGLLKDMKLKLIEPLRELFKDEVRALGRLLSIPAPLVQRHPFPGPGLAIRILGPVTREQVKILQLADSIYIGEIRKAGLYDKISQAFAVLLPVRAVGVMGDKRTYEQVIALRAVQSEDFMTADWFAFPPEVLRRISSRITNEVEGINRVTYDISSKPPATVEWLTTRSNLLECIEL